MTKENKNILIGIGVLILLYLWWTSMQTKGAREIVNGNGNGHRTFCYSNCIGEKYTSLASTSLCGSGEATDYPLDNPPSCLGSTEVYGCMDRNATNYNSQATIDDNSCNYPAPQHCTNVCCSANGVPNMPSNYPSCNCPQSNYVWSGGKPLQGSCVLAGVVGCMDINATNFNPLATIPSPQSCSYNQATRNCYSNCIGSNYNTLANTQNACGSGSASNYPNTVAPYCGGRNTFTQI